MTDKNGSSYLTMTGKDKQITHSFIVVFFFEVLKLMSKRLKKKQALTQRGFWGVMSNPPLKLMIHIEGFCEYS